MPLPHVPGRPEAWGGTGVHRPEDAHDAIVGLAARVEALERKPDPQPQPPRLPAGWGTRLAGWWGGIPKSTTTVIRADWVAVKSWGVVKKDADTKLAIMGHCSPYTQGGGNERFEFRFTTPDRANPGRDSYFYLNPANTHMTAGLYAVIQNHPAGSFQITLEARCANGDMVFDDQTGLYAQVWETHH